MPMGPEFEEQFGQIDSIDIRASGLPPYTIEVKFNHFLLHIGV